MSSIAVARKKNTQPSPQNRIVEVVSEEGTLLLLPLLSLSHFLCLEVVSSLRDNDFVTSVVKLFGPLMHIVKNEGYRRGREGRRGTEEKDQEDSWK